MKIGASTNFESAQTPKSQKDLAFRKRLESRYRKLKALQNKEFSFIRQKEMAFITKELS